MNSDNSPKTLIEAVQYFSDPDVCHKYMKGLKWPDGPVCCPECGSVSVGEIKSRRMFQCREKQCRKQFSVKVGTIFEDSPLPLSKWFVGVWCIVNAKNGISSCELARAIGVTQKSAWHMLHRIRACMQTKTYRKIVGEIEADECHVGGRTTNMRKAKRIARLKDESIRKGKVAVHGLLERESGEVRAKVIHRLTRENLHRHVRENVKTGERLYTDEAMPYRTLRGDFIHESVKHAIDEYVRGRVHTNGIENFWSLLKRTLKGTYVAVDIRHLQSYLDEQCRRFNLRKLDDAGRFHAVMKYVLGQKLPYSILTGANATN